MHMQLTAAQVRQALEALNHSAFNMETVAHLCGEERRLLPLAESLRLIIRAIERETEGRT